MNYSDLEKGLCGLGGISQVYNSLFKFQIIKNKQIWAENFRMVDIEINALVNLQINIIFISIFRKVRKMQQIRVSFA